MGREDIAVKAYGYILFSPQIEQELRKRWPDDEVSWFGRQDYHRDTPLPGIVKHLAPTDVNISPELAPIMLRDLDELHRCGILHGDIRELNYLNGKLIDFSSSSTIPHADLYERKSWGEYFEKLHPGFDDLYFDSMVYWWNQGAMRPKITTFALQNQDYSSRLRPNPLRRFRPPRVNVLEFPRRMKRKLPPQETERPAAKRRRH